MEVARISPAGWFQVCLKGQLHYTFEMYSLFPQSAFSYNISVYTTHTHTWGCNPIRSNGFKYQFFAHDFHIATSSLDFFPELQICRVNCSLTSPPGCLISVLNLAWPKLNVIFFFLQIYSSLSLVHLSNMKWHKHLPNCSSQKARSHPTS